MRRSSLFPLVLSLAALPAAAQGSPPPPAVDSLAALREARTAQAAFERFRFHQLPGTHQAPAGSCTERIGRWCFWFAGGADQVPPEPPGIQPRRDRLVASLLASAEAIPGDGWIQGQGVRYLMESGDLVGALALARSCRAEPWWCRALEGYALHRGGRWPEAGAAFAAALDAMPAEERARWEDPTVLLRPDDRRALRRLDPGERAEAESRLWWLADPFWSEPGNDRLTEHYARWTVGRMQDRARQVERTPWGEDTREVVLRYGWFTAWERLQPPIHTLLVQESVIGHTVDRSWEWLPPLPMARDPGTLAPDVWPLEVDAPTATRYAPPYARRMVPLETQLARFRRDGATVLVAGYALPADSLPPRAALRVAAVAMAGPDRPAVHSTWSPTAASGALYLELPAGGAVVSVEAREDSSGVAGRWRGPVAATPGARISDLLLLAHPDARPSDLAEAARIARGSTRVRAGEQVAVYWEVYGVPETDSLTLRLALDAPRAGWVRRGLQAVGLARGGGSPGLRVRDGTPGGEVVGRALAVALPAGLRPGEYTLELTVEAPGFPPATARRTVTVER